MRYPGYFFAVLGLLCVSSAVVADKTIAHSKSLDMSFTAVGDPWCGREVKFHVTAKDATRFDTQAFENIVRKLGAVLLRECPEVESLMIQGRVAGKDVWQGSAKKGAAWRITKVTSPSPAGKSAPGVEQVAREASRSVPPSKPPTPQEKPPTSGSSSSTAAVAERSKTEASGGPAATTGAEKHPSSIASTSSGAQSESGSPGPVEDTGAAESAEAEKTARAAPGGVHFPECLEMFRWAAEKAKSDGNVTGYYYLPESKGKYLLKGLRNESLRAEYGKSIDEWTDEELVEWFDRYTACEKKLRKQVYKIERRKRYRSELYASYTGGKTFFSQLLYMGYGKDKYLKVIRYQAKVHEKRKEAKALRDKYLAAIEAMKPTRASLQKIDKEMRNDPRLQYLEPTERQAYGTRLGQLYMELYKKVLLEEQRAQIQGLVDRQYKELVEASPYDRLRFFTSLKLDRQRLEKGVIRPPGLRSYRVSYKSPLAHAVELHHPGEFLRHVKEGTGDAGEPLYMLVQADDGEIELPYRMKVEQNQSSEEMDGWLLIKAAPRFSVSYEDGKPVFGIVVESAVSCRSEKCLDEKPLAEVIKEWYGDESLKFTKVESQSEASR